DEMVHVAKEMKRQGFTVPLLIGGATTSLAHASVKIAPEYDHGVVHVLDASRVVNVVSALLSDDQKPAFIAENAVKQQKQRDDFPARRARKPLLTLDQARANAPVFDWTTADIPRPHFLGARVYDQGEMSGLVAYIDWGPSCRTCEPQGRIPDILTDATVGEEATKLFADAQALLARIVAEKRYKPKAIQAFWPANAVGDTIEVYADESRSEVIDTFACLRQQLQKGEGQPNLSLADYLAPKTSGRIDYVGAFAVTAGPEVEAFAAEFRAATDDYNAIMAQALGDRLAEAMAELFHKKAREACGYGKTENLEMKDI